MNLLQYSPWSLSGTVHLMAQKMLNQCPILGRFFTRHVGQDSINVSWDVVTGSASIMRGLRVHSPGMIGAQVGEKTISARLPKFPRDPPRRSRRPADAAAFGRPEPGQPPGEGEDHARAKRPGVQIHPHIEVHGRTVA